LVAPVGIKLGQTIQRMAAMVAMLALLALPPLTMRVAAEVALTAAT
jgi:hypothetical protein